jgi:hypothetical protein
MRDAKSSVSSRGIPALAALYFIFMLYSVSSASADTPADNKPTELFEAAKTAVAGAQLSKTQVGGFTVGKNSYGELPRGAVLIGFDIGLGKFIDHEAIYALRPIYLTTEGNVSTKDYGLFSDGGTRRTTRSRVTRTTQIKAKPGYAVGALRIRKELGIRALSAVFMKIDGAALDPTDAYSSPWAGDANGGEEIVLNGNGAPIIGIHGNQDSDRVLGLGLYYIKNAAVKSKSPVAQAPGAGASEPAAPTARSGSGAPGSQPAAEPGKNEAAGTGSVAGEKKDDSSNAAAAEPAEGKSEEAVTVEVADGGSYWVPILTFGAVTIPIFVVMLALFGRKAAPRDARPRPMPAAPGGPLWGAQAAGVSYPMDPHEYIHRRFADPQARADATKALTLGLIGLVAWCLPIAGIPVGLYGLAAGMRGMQSDRANMALIGTVLSGLCLIAAVSNAILGVMMAMGGKFGR